MSLTGPQRSLLEKFFGPENVPAEKTNYISTVLNEASNRSNINQIRGVTKAGSTGSGIPKHVTNVSVLMSSASAGATSKIVVTFRRDPTDSTFTGVTVYAKGYQGNQSPTQVGFGTDAPLTVILNNTGESVSLIVQATGNGGSAPMSTAPSCGVKLPASSNGGFGTITTTNITTAQIPSTKTAVSLNIPAAALPWNNSGNPSFPIGTLGSSFPIVAPIVLFPGASIVVSYVSGGVIFSTGQPITTDLQGDPNSSGTGSSGGTFFPAHYVSGSTLKVCGLVGAFTDDNGGIDFRSSNRGHESTVWD